MTLHQVAKELFEAYKITNDRMACVYKEGRAWKFEIDYWVICETEGELAFMERFLPFDENAILLKDLPLPVVCCVDNIEWHIKGKYRPKKFHVKHKEGI